MWTTALTAPPMLLHKLDTPFSLNIRCCHVHFLDQLSCTVSAPLPLLTSLQSVHQPAVTASSQGNSLTRCSIAGEFNPDIPAAAGPQGRVQDWTGHDHHWWSHGALAVLRVSHQLNFHRVHTQVACTQLQAYMYVPILQRLHVVKLLAHNLPVSLTLSSHSFSL